MVVIKHQVFRHRRSKIAAIQRLASEAFRLSGPIANSQPGSYVPYNPEVWPTEAAGESTPNTRAAMWFCGLLLYLVGIVAWVAWMKMPPRIQPPFAIIPLGEDSELRLVHFANGTDAGIAPNDTFHNRIRLPQASNLSNQRIKDVNGGAWLVFSHFRPGMKLFGPADFESFEIIEEGSPYSLKPARIEATNGLYTVVLLPAVPRRSPMLTLKFTRSGRVQQSTIPNPFCVPASTTVSSSPPGAIRSGKTAPLPQQLEGGGFTVRLEEIDLRNEQVAGHGPVPKARPRFRITHPEAKPSDYFEWYEWHDEGGNLVKNGRTCDRRSALRTTTAPDASTA